MQSVAQLRRSGYKVRVNHMRQIKLPNGEWFLEHTNIPYEEINPRGGVTRVFVTAPDGTELYGEARCSERDNYNKRIGVNIALGRAFAPPKPKDDEVEVTE